MPASDGLHAKSPGLFRDRDFLLRRAHLLRGQDLNLRPLGYEPSELPNCSTPRYKNKVTTAARDAVESRPLRRCPGRAAARCRPDDDPAARPADGERSPAGGTNPPGRAALSVRSRRAERRYSLLEHASISCGERIGELLVGHTVGGEVAGGQCGLLLGHGLLGDLERAAQLRIRRRVACRRAGVVSPSVGGVVSPPSAARAHLTAGTVASPALAPESPPKSTSSASSRVSSKAIWSPKATSTFCSSG